MPRPKKELMARRPRRQEKPLIYIFCEGESEQQYAEYLRKAFRGAAVLKIHAEALKTGIFSSTRDQFQKNRRYIDDVNDGVIDEIWLFFDVEAEDGSKWTEQSKIIRWLRKLKKKTGIRVRLLMTTGCVEYWFLLHFQQCRTPVCTPNQKDRIRHMVEKYCPDYKKGDYTTISQIAERYPTAVQNGEWLLRQAVEDGLPTMEDTDQRNQWLFQCGLPFTTVHEAVHFLQEKQNAVLT